MDKFTTVSGVAAPLKRSNVDTDQIIPAVYLKRVTKTGFEDALFAGWRQDPDFVLNQRALPGRPVLVAGPDFGTGSRREHAVWALRDFGFTVVVSPRFGDIFRGNSGKQGLLAAIVTEPEVERIWAAIEANPGIEATVDLETQRVSLSGCHVPFEVDAYTRWRLIEGLDDIGLTLRDETAITEFESRRASWRPEDIAGEVVNSLVQDAAAAGARVGLKSDEIVIRGGKPLDRTHRGPRGEEPRDQGHGGVAARRHPAHPPRRARHQRRQGRPRAARGPRRAHHRSVHEAS